MSSFSQLNENCGPRINNKWICLEGSLSDMVVPIYQKAKIRNHPDILKDQLLPFCLTGSDFVQI